MNDYKQNKYTLLKYNLDKISYDIIFIKEIIIDMSNNLSNLHKLKMYENCTINYS